VASIESKVKECALKLERVAMKWRQVAGDETFEPDVVAKRAAQQAPHLRDKMLEKDVCGVVGSRLRAAQSLRKEVGAVERLERITQQN
jgi:hypothetical protein